MSDESPVNRRFRTNLKHERESHGWTQGELARHLADAGWSALGHQTTITRIEAGTRPAKLDEATAIADVLGVDIKTLTEDARTYMFRRSQQDVLASRQTLAHAGIKHMHQQTILESNMSSPLLGGQATVIYGPEAVRARQLLDESPGDAAMSGLKILMDGEGIEDYLEFRQWWRTRPRDERVRKTKGATGDA